jgi:cellulose synthase operon protein C
MVLNNVSLSALYRIGRLKFLRAGVVWLPVVLLAACGQVSFTAEEHIQRGLEFERQGNLNAASIEYRNAFQRDPTEGEGRFRLGMLLLRIGDAAGAEVELGRAQELGWDPDQLRLPLLEAALLQGRDEQVLDETRLIEGYPVEQVPEVLVLRGAAYLLRGQPDEAELAFREALKLDDDWAEALLGMAHVQVSIDDHAGARSWVLRALDADPALGRAWELLGDLEYHEGRYPEAEAAYAKGIETREPPLMPRFKRALTRLAMGDLEGANHDASVLERDFSQHPVTSYTRGLIAFREERYRDAQTAFEESLLHSENYMPAVLELGSTHLRLGNAAQAETHFRRYLTHVPHSTRAAVQLAQVLVEQGRVADARRLLESSVTHVQEQEAELAALNAYVALAGSDVERGRALLVSLSESQDTSRDLKEWVGSQLIRHGDREAGLATLREAAASESGEVSADRNLILLELQAGNFEEALRGGHALSEREPEQAEPWNYIGAALVGLGRVDEARAAFARGLEIEPGYVPIAMNLASLELQAGRPDAARDALASIQAHQPGEVRSAQRLAELELQAGRPFEAARWLEKVVAAEPGVLAHHLTLARLQIESEQTEEAIRTLERAREYHPGSPQLLVSLGEAQAAAGQLEQAVDSLRAALEEAPDNLNILGVLAQVQSRAGDTEGMEQTLREILELSADNYAARAILVRHMIDHDRLDEAHAELNQLSEADASRPESLALAGELALQEGKADLAVRFYQEALAQTPAVREWVLRLAEAQRLAGDDLQARATVRDWVEAHPDDLSALHLLAGWESAAGDLDMAIQSYERIVTRQPEDVVALNNAAWLLREENTHRALEYAERAGQLAPNEPAILDTLGVVLLKVARPLDRSRC